MNNLDKIDKKKILEDDSPQEKQGERDQEHLCGYFTSSDHSLLLSQFVEGS